MNLYAASQPASSQTSTDCDGVDVTLDPSAAPLMRLHSRAHSAGLNGCDGGPMSWPEFRLRGLISIGGRGETWAMGEALRGIIRRPVGRRVVQRARFRVSPPYQMSALLHAGQAR